MDEIVEPITCPRCGRAGRPAVIPGLAMCITCCANEVRAASRPIAEPERQGLVARFSRGAIVIIIALAAIGATCGACVIVSSW